MTRRQQRALLGAAAIALAALAWCAPGQARVYWANQAANTIGRANGDGSGANQDFITGATAPLGVAVDGSHVYWAHGGAVGRIGRSNLDGSGPNQAYVRTAAAPQGVAVDGTSVYWTQTVSGRGQVGFAALDGSTINQSYLPTGPSPCGIAVDPDKEYWANRGDPGSIGRAHGAFAPTQGFVTDARDPCGVAVTPTYVYWANRAANAIGRARVDGTETIQAFIPAPGPCGVAVDGSHVYWSTARATIGRANLDGGAVNQSFITGAQQPCGVAVDATVDPSPSSYVFPSTRVGAQSAQAFFLRDSSSSALAVTRVALAGRDARDFQVIGDSCLVNVTPAAGGCVVNVRLRPLLEGVLRASLRVTSSASNSPTDIPLRGRAFDPTPPRLGRVSVRPAFFRAALSLSGDRRRRPRGTTFRFWLSKQARMTFTVGRRTRTGFRPVGRFVRTGRPGANRQRFAGTVAGRRLRPGRYRIRVVAADGARRASKPQRLRFTILR